MFFRQESQPARRLVWFGIFFILCGLLLIGRLVYLQGIQGDRYRDIARRQQARDFKLESPRAPIYDRHGALLAGSITRDRAIIDPRRLPDMEVIHTVLTRPLGLDPLQLEERIRLHQNNPKVRSGYLIVKRRLTPEESERLRSFSSTAKFFYLQQEAIRVYPKGRLGQHVVGTVDENIGVVGIEKSFDEVLSTVAPCVLSLRDVRGVEFARIPTQCAPCNQCQGKGCRNCKIRSGRPLRLTIDERVQLVAQQSLRAAVEKVRANTGSVVVMDARSGEIHALASYPEYDRDHPPRTMEELQARLNYAISAPFEPGSIFKVITFATLLDTQGLNPKEMINCGGGSIQVGGQLIRDHHAYGALTAEDVIAKSSNVGTIRLGLRISEQTFREYLKRFGFGQRTGIPLPAESAGTVRKSWKSHSIGYISIGHEISTTTLQMAVALASFANGGYKVTPAILMEQVQDPRNFPRILKAETAAEMRRLLRRVVEMGTGKAAAIPGYSAAGKTGSAQIYDFQARRYTHRYNASFAGFSPAEDPRFVVVATINGSPVFGGVVAAPVFSEVMRETLRLNHVPMDLPLAPGAPPPADALQVADVASPRPAADPPAEVAQSFDLLRESNAEGEPALRYLGPPAPNFLGKPMRAVLEESLASGIRVVAKGRGVARRQSPPAGAMLGPGNQVEVEFEP